MQEAVTTCDSHIGRQRPHNAPIMAGCAQELDQLGDDVSARRPEEEEEEEAPDQTGLLDRPPSDNSPSILIPTALVPLPASRQIFPSNPGKTLAGSRGSCSAHPCHRLQVSMPLRIIVIVSFSCCSPEW